MPIARLRLCYKNMGGGGQTSLISRWCRNQIPRLEETGGQSVIGSEDAGYSGDGLKKGILDRARRVFKWRTGRPEDYSQDLFLLGPLTGESGGVIPSEAMGFAPAMICFRKETEVEEGCGAMWRRWRQRRWPERVQEGQPQMERAWEGGWQRGEVCETKEERRSRERDSSVGDGVGGSVGGMATEEFKEGGVGTGWGRAPEDG
jgi:hypothetical protein